MLKEVELQHEKDNKRKGVIVSILFHVLIIILILLPLLKYPDPPPGQQGVLVSFGEPDMGQGDSRPDTQQEEYVEPEPPAETEMAEPEMEAVTEPIEAEQPEVVTQEDPSEVAFRKQEEERKKREEAEKKAEAERKKAIEEAERKKKEAEEARKKKLEDSKKQLGDLLSGDGKGQTDKAGNQGDPGGDPDASALEGISTGQGTVGGGLEGRGVVSKPKITDKSQKTGRVVVRICVDRSGTVFSAEYTQAGSKTIDGVLRRIAVENAKKFKFSPGSIDRQCGTITVDFKVE